MAGVVPKAVPPTGDHLDLFGLWSGDQWKSGPEGWGHFGREGGGVRDGAAKLTIDGVEVGEVEVHVIGNVGPQRTQVESRCVITLPTDPTFLGRQRATLLAAVPRVGGRGG